MRWNDRIKLIKVTSTGTNENGFANPPEEQSRFVFCNKYSVGCNEFFNAQQTGYTASLKVNIHAIDYKGEELAEFQGKRHKILRAYESKNGEIIELTLSDLSERSASSHGKL